MSFPVFGNLFRRPALEEGVYAEDYALVLRIDLDDLERKIHTVLEELGRLLHALYTEVREGHESLDVVTQLNNRSPVEEACDEAVGLGTDVKLVSELGPGVLPRLLHAEADTPFVAVDLKDNYFDVVALFDHL